MKMASIFTGFQLLLDDIDADTSPDDMETTSVKEFLNNSLDDLETTRRHYSDLFERFRDMDEGEFFPRS